MRKRYLKLAAATAASVCVVLGVLAMLPPRPGVTKANYERIQAGMTLAEVQDVFGSKGARFDGYLGKPALWWQGEDRSYAIIFFDEEKKVIEPAQWGDSPESLGDKICRWIHWPWWK